MEAAYLHDLHAECLEPGQEPVQGARIPEGAVQDRFDRLHRGSESLEVEQGFGWQEPGYPDLVVGRCQRSSPSVSQGQYSTFPRPGLRRPMHYG